MSNKISYIFPNGHQLLVIESKNDNGDRIYKASYSGVGRFKSHGFITKTNSLRRVANRLHNRLYNANID